jgi:hypothetical protein
MPTDTTEWRVSDRNDYRPAGGKKLLNTGKLFWPSPFGKAAQVKTTEGYFF